MAQRAETTADENSALSDGDVTVCRTTVPDSKEHSLLTVDRSLRDLNIDHITVLYYTYPVLRLCFMKQTT